VVVKVGGFFLRRFIQVVVEDGFFVFFLGNPGGLGQGPPFTWYKYPLRPRLLFFLALALAFIETTLPALLSLKSSCVSRPFVFFATPTQTSYRVPISFTIGIGTSFSSDCEFDIIYLHQEKILTKILARSSETTRE
jgi:hypothetical protein